MTDMTLQDAIVELRLAKDTPWTASNVADGHPYPTSLAGSVATILNAVASGDLIPRADHEAAVALVVEQAVKVGADIAERPRPDGFPEAASNAYHSGAMDVVDAIRALAPASGIAQLEALRAKLAEAEAREKALLEALIWCSGSDDFQHGGKARAGWLKLCAPLIASRTEEGGE